MSAAEPPRDPRVLVIGLSPVKNEEVVTSLRDLGIDAVGCTEPDTAAERYNARQFKVIAFGRAALWPSI
jgi:PleD family two-component response regulator